MQKKSAVRRAVDRSLSHEGAKFVIDDYEPKQNLTQEMYAELIIDKLSIFDLTDQELAEALDYAMRTKGRNLYKLEETEKSEKWAKLYEDRHKQPEQDELVWEEYTGKGPLYRWTSSASAKDAKKQGIAMQGTEQDGIPTSPSGKRGAALGSGAVSLDCLLIITVSKIPNFRARYTGTRNGPKEIKVLVNIPADAIEVVDGSNVG
ncbi:MAG: hypothetical protein WDN04_15505 [Rhodospirillales bacterium]